MTIFRDEFGAKFVFLFSTLLFLKVFHWLSADRVEYMEQTPSVSRLFHVRMLSVLCTLFGLDLFLVAFSIEVLLLDKNRMGIMIMFASEFMILSATLWSIIAKYAINIQDSRSEEPWEGKSMYVFFVDMATDFVKLMTYVTFFALIVSFYGLPLNIIRDVYITARSFFGRVRDFIKYRAATKNMDTRFPDASHQDLSAMSDGTCIICREEMMVTEQDNRDGSSEQQTNTPVGPSRDSSSGGLNETPKKLPCGHIFHFHCLRSWLERQQSCPTCRQTVFASPETRGNTNTDGVAGAAARPGPLNRSNNGNVARTGTGERGNATETARDRLQGFLQQLQTDAQRVREQANLQMPRGVGAPHQQTTALASPQPTPSTGGEQAAASTRNDTPNRTNRPTENNPNSPDSSSSSARSRIPVQKALISSLFGQSEGSNRRGESTNSSQGAHHHRIEQRDDLVSSLVPPAPWTLKPSKMANTVDVSLSQEDASMSSKVEESADSSSTPIAVSKDTDEHVKNPDPIDAREAARAATLRRFGLSNGSTSAPSSSAIQTAQTSEDKGKQKAAEQPSKANMPGDPVLIPLFDPSKVMNYESEFVSQLPFPLALGNGSVNLSQRIPGLNLDSPDTILQFTDAQLQSLSKNSREGLEERLRLLTRVEGAIGNLVEEITRALSVFPSHDIIEESIGTEATSTSKGKEVATSANDISE